MSDAPSAAGAPAAPAVPARVIFAFVAMTAIWGSTWLVIRHQLGTVDVGWSVSYRFGIAAAMIYVIARWRRETLRIGRDELVFLLIIATIQFVFNFRFVYAAEAYVTSGLVAMLFSLMIIPSAILGRIVLGHPVGRAFIAGSILAIGGMVLLFWHEVAAARIGSTGTLIGIILTIGAVLSAATGNVMQLSNRLKGLSFFAICFWTMGLGALLNGLIAFVTAGPPTIDTDPVYLVGALYLGLVGSGVNAPLYLYVSRHIGPARAAYSSVLTPVVAMSLSTLFEGYRWTPEAVAGSALAFAGLLFALKARSPAPKSA